MWGYLLLAAAMLGCSDDDPTFENKSIAPAWKYQTHSIAYKAQMLVISDKDGVAAVAFHDAYNHDEPKDGKRQASALSTSL